jgi:uncharacterized membrane protein
MIKKNLKILIVTTIVILLPIIAGVMLWDQLPQKLPMHWNMRGEVDGWCGKAFAVFGMPLILTALQWLMAFVTSVDPKKQNQSPKMMALVLWLVPALSVMISAFSYASALGKEMLVNVIVPAFLGGMFVVIGNYMPKCKQNYTVGIRIPWTLENEENWNRTHRFGGFVWVIGGIAVILGGCFFGLLWLVLPVLAVMGVLPIAYSYILYRKGVGVKKEEEENE